MLVSRSQFVVIGHAKQIKNRLTDKVFMVA